MSVPNRRKRRKSDGMNFVYPGPFAPLLDSRVGRALPLTKKRYTPDSAESWTIGSRIPAVAAALEVLFGREYGSSADDTPKKRRRRRGGRRATA